MELGATEDSLHLYRTADGGETWHQVPAAQRFEDSVDVWATRDGGLVVVEEAGDPYLSRDGGETFARTDLPVRSAWALPGGGFRAWPRDRAGRQLRPASTPSSRTSRRRPCGRR